MAQKQFLHELLKEEQEPFRLKNYISDRRSQLKKIPPPPPSLPLNKRRRPSDNPRRGGALCKHACFLSLQTSPDVRKSPLFEFPSPIKSPGKNGAVFLHVPSKTAALLVEAAMRIQHRPRPKNVVGLGLLGSFLKRLKDRSSSRNAKSRAIDKNATSILSSLEEEEKARFSTCSNRRPSSSSANWTESNEASTSSYCSDAAETRFCTSPFRFNLLRSPPTSGRRTPEFSSPCRRVNQETENCVASKSDDVQEVEDKEQCSPVSILDAPFEDDDHVSRDDDDDNDDDDYDLQCSYENVQRAKHQLLHRLRRFEELAELDTIELDRDSVEGSDHEVEESEPSPCRRQGVEPILTRVLNQLSLRGHSRNASSDMKKLVSDLIVEEKSETVGGSCDDEVVTSRVCKRLHSWGDVELNTIDMMIGFDFKREIDGWTRCNVRAEDVPAEIEVAIYGLLVEELSDELLYMDTRHQ